MPRGCLAITDVLETSGKSNDFYEVLARRARPQTFAEVVGQEHVTRTLINAISSGRLAHAFVFSGMRGVGKTTTARILAKALNCEKGPTPEPCNVCRSCVEIAEGRSMDVLEVDAASQTGIDATRELLETVKYQPAAGRYRVYIIDEAHGLSKQAVDAFLKTLEEPPAHAKFILATTAPQKLTSTILSRCQRFDFRAVPGDTIVETLAAMVRGEEMEADDEALAAIARESGGSLRDATSLLDQVLAFADGRIDAGAVGLALGLPDVAAVRELLDAIVARDPARSLEVVGRVVGQGTDLARFAHDLLQRIRNLTVLVVAGPGALADLTRQEIEELGRAREGLGPEDLQRWFRILLSGAEEVARSTQPRLVLEMAVLRMATMTPLVPLDQLVGRLEALERGARGGPGSGGRSRAGPSPKAPAPSDAPARTAPAAPPPKPAPRSQPPPKPAPRPQPPVERADDGRGSSPGKPQGPEPRQTAPKPSRNGAPPPSPAAQPEPLDDPAAQKRWKGVVGELQKQQAARFFRLAFSEVLALGNGVIRIAVSGANAVNELQKPETKRLIEAAIAEEYGESLAFEPVPADGDGGAGRRSEPVSLERQGRDDPLVRMSVEVLSGRVEGVVARSRREGS